MGGVERRDASSGYYIDRRAPLLPFLQRAVPIDSALPLQSVLIRMIIRPAFGS